ncbi:expressed unknown protein [Seminavis robusta]|uniref:DUF6824 domain-containing protein n=1 Tax=Seminavis robusta TaxID=568900 RepID=A0A9N8DJ96_9STRA|nr:expressed unknown protein [Seminavis robusta]|eukprot:Sro114_g056540.1 n/a (335) ;mRNA; f:108639-110219
MHTGSSLLKLVGFLARARLQQIHVTLRTFRRCIPPSLCPELTQTLHQTQETSNMASHNNPHSLHLDLNKPIGPERGALDAIIGRGGCSNHDVETIIYRNSVDPYKFEYLCSSREDKLWLVDFVIDNFLAQGRRIVGKWQNQYYELTREGYEKKVKQRLRERGPEYLIGLLRTHLSPKDFAAYRNPISAAILLPPVPPVAVEASSTRAQANEENSGDEHQENGADEPLDEEDNADTGAVEVVSSRVEEMTVDVAVPAEAPEPVPPPPDDLSLVGIPDLGPGHFAPIDIPDLGPDPLDYTMELDDNSSLLSGGFPFEDAMDLNLGMDIEAVKGVSN